jgi:hypothetical protein
MYIKVLSILTVVFLGITYVVMAENAPQTVAFNEEEKPNYVLHVDCIRYADPQNDPVLYI